MNNDLQEKITRRMEELGLNQRSLALRAGLHEDAVRNILRGRSRHPRIDTMEKIQRVLWPGQVTASHSGLAEHSTGGARWNASQTIAPRPHDDRPAEPPVDSGMLVEATLLVREIFEAKRLSPEDIKETALAVCRLAHTAGTNLITRTLVLYFLEAMEQQERAAPKPRP